MYEKTCESYRSLLIERDGSNGQFTIHIKKTSNENNVFFSINLDFRLNEYLDSIIGMLSTKRPVLNDTYNE